jgi:hypothetical protein
MSDRPSDEQVDHYASLGIASSGTIRHLVLLAREVKESRDTIASLRGACGRYEAAIQRRERILEAIRALSQEEFRVGWRAVIGKHHGITSIEEGDAYRVGFTDAMDELKALLEADTHE